PMTAPTRHEPVHNQQVAHRPTLHSASQALQQLMNSLRLALASPSRTPRTAVVTGRLLAIAFLLCFSTGVFSHFLQDPLPWMVFPTRPVWIYQLTQGIHITAGILCFPLIFAKLYVVFPELFQTPPVRSFPHFLERASITLFVSASLIEITIGLLNTFQWYALFPFAFRQTHYALSFVIIGSLAIHIAVKLPVINRHWTKKRSELAPDSDAKVDAARLAAAPTPASTPASGVTARLFNWVDASPEASGAVLADVEASSTAPARPRTQRPVKPGLGNRFGRWMVRGGTPTDPPILIQAADGVVAEAFDFVERTPDVPAKASRRAFFTVVGIASAVLVATTAGQSFRVLDGTNIFAPRKMGVGPNALPVNRTAKAAKVLDTATSTDWTLTVSNGGTAKAFSRAQLLALPQHTVELPIACVEGWSQTATWRGVRLRDLVEAVGGDASASVRAVSLEQNSSYALMDMGPEYARDELTLVALELNGEALDLDHGYPARMIAPGRPGVLQTKWLSTLEVI
ncbi:MAG: molybdopterin-binding protein, partial [Glaciihabitans sp.]|nr:molybdopterin-binding protein [Glaciihabitans sp.]